MRSSSDPERSARMHLPCGVTNVMSAPVSRVAAMRSERAVTMRPWLVVTLCLALWSRASAQQTYYGWVDFFLGSHSVLCFGNDVVDSRSHFRQHGKHMEVSLYLSLTVTVNGPLSCWISFWKHEMYLYFLSFLEAEMTMVFEIISSKKQGLISSPWSVLCLLMPWWRKWPRHQQPWYRSCYPRIIMVAAPEGLSCYIAMNFMNYIMILSSMNL